MSNKKRPMDMAHLSFLIILLFLSSSCKSDDQLTQGNPLSSADMLISEGGDFALGFFSPSSDNRSYLAIWYHQIPGLTPIWVANRDNPVTPPSSAKLAITDNLKLVLSDSKGRTLWTTTNNVTTGGAGDGATAVLLNSGNFVLRSANGTDIWQSFDHVSATIIPNMKVLLSYKAQVAARLLPWKGVADPSTGDFSGTIDPNSNLQFFIWRGSRPHCRLTFFTDILLAGAAYQSTTSFIMYQSMVDTGNEFYYSYRLSDGSPYTRMVLDYTGTMKLFAWNNTTSSWRAAVFERPSDGGCDLYASCGLFGYCDNTAAVPTCRCLDGFEPFYGLDISKGCRRTEAMECGKQSRFVTMAGMQVPDNFLRIRNVSFDQCAAECSTNCSCTAYAYVNVSSSAGTLDEKSTCLVWAGDLVDTGKAASFGENLYIKLAGPHVQRKSTSLKILLPVIACLLLLAFITIFWTCKYRGKWQKKKTEKRMVLEYLRSTNEAGDIWLEFPFISFEDIVAATDNFSDSNMLGKGGFGKVYKGILHSTKEIAVKRLCKGSGQGIQEFRNEVVLIANLQHKNLVKLLGCCIHEDEKMLVYEYLPNKSLDYFLFDSARKHTLQWPERYKIIQGIARGILYLHQDSRLTIVHRDLKASNILLDKEMNPKISDFGLARIFSGNQLEENTSRVVGTYGYISPEYAMEGAFSVKTDTYSFGVLLLEIVSGLKISSPHLIVGFSNLIVYAWNLWKDANIKDLVDSSIKENCPPDEVSRCIQIGLLCVQDNPDCRPLISEVLSMLQNKTTQLPIPMLPVYFAWRNAEPGRAGSNRAPSLNGLSLTELEGR